MARTNTRQRALARAKLERQIARRAATARRRRQVQAGLGAFLALVLVGFGVAWAAGAFDKKKQGPTEAGECVWSPQTGEGVKDVGKPPTTGIPKSGTQLMTITTNQGVIEVELDVSKTPCAAASFAHLAGKQFFDNTKCHRLTNSGLYVLQCGDPSGTGRGGPGYKFADENLPTTPQPDPSASAPATPAPLYRTGMVAMANSGAGTNSSQFFIVYKDSALDPNYTVLGTVTKGLDVVDKIAAGGVGDGGKSANDGPPKLETVIQSLAMGEVRIPEPAPSGSDPSAPASSAPASPQASASSGQA